MRGFGIASYVWLEQFQIRPALGAIGKFLGLYQAMAINKIDLLIAVRTPNPIIPDV
jgi:hypothetical protein